MTNKRRVIAAFDFDDTLITVNTFPDFLRHSFSLPVFIFRSFKSLPTLFLFGLGMINNDVAKERVITIFLKGMKKAHFEELCRSYMKRLDTLTDKVALDRVRWHQSKGDEVVIISASIEDWIKPWAKEHLIKTVIATKLATTDDKLTGKLATLNCHGQEKVRRFLMQYPARSGYTIYMYGDGKSDKQMFEMADLAFKGRFE